MIEPKTKKTFDNFIKQNGHYILVGHTEMKNHCDCFNANTNEGDVECPKCFGIGWSYKWHITKVRRSSAGQALSSSSDKMELDVPIEFSGSSYKYYFTTENVVNDLDLIIEFDLPENRKQYNLYVVYNDSSFEGLNGDTVYKGVLANRLQLNNNHVKKGLMSIDIDSLKEV